MRRCSAQSRSFLPGPGGTAWLHLDRACAPAVIWQLAEAGQKQDQLKSESVHASRGSPLRRPADYADQGGGAAGGGGVSGGKVGIIRGLRGRLGDCPAGG